MKIKLSKSVAGKGLPATESPMVLTIRIKNEGYLLPKCTDVLKSRAHL